MRWRLPDSNKWTWFLNQIKKRPIFSTSLSVALVCHLCLLTGFFLKKKPQNIPNKTPIAVHVSYEKMPKPQPAKKVTKKAIARNTKSHKKKVQKVKTKSTPAKKKKKIKKKTAPPTPRPLKKKIVYRKKSPSKQIAAIQELKKALEKFEEKKPQQNLNSSPPTPLNKTSPLIEKKKITTSNNTPNKNLAIDSNEPIEQKYLLQLISHLKIALELPEYGKVKLKLTLTHLGNVEGLEVLHTESKKNRDYLLKNLHLVTFPPFLEEFKNKEKHVFVFTFCNDI